MRRAPVVIAGTVAGLAGVLSFHSHKPTSTIAVVPPTGGKASSATSAPPTRGGAAPATTAPPTSAAGGSGTATGSVEPYPYGQLSVTVTESGGRITNLQMASLSETDSRSVMIDDQAIPMLQQEVLAAQSANIQGVSGATFTSQAYAASVQSALDQLKA